MACPENLVLRRALIDDGLRPSECRNVFALSSRQADKRKCAERTARCGSADVGRAAGSNSNSASSSKPGAMHANTPGRLRTNLYNEQAYNTNSQVKQGLGRRTPHLIVYARLF